jgi:hypothetical protein
MDYIGGMNSIQRMPFRLRRQLGNETAGLCAWTGVPRRSLDYRATAIPGRWRRRWRPAKRRAGQSQAEDGLQASPGGVVSDLTNGLIEPNDLYSPYGYDFTALHALGHCCNPTGSTTGSLIDSTIDVVAAADFSDADVKSLPGPLYLPGLQLCATCRWTAVDRAATRQQARKQPWMPSGRLPLPTAWIRP